MFSKVVSLPFVHRFVVTHQSTILFHLISIVNFIPLSGLHTSDIVYLISLLSILIDALVYQSYTLLSSYFKCFHFIVFHF